jgi:hypothetical protein
MKKLIEKFKLLKSNFLKKWNAETPKVAKCVRNIAGIITVALPTAWGIVSSMPKMLDVFPDGFTKFVGYVTLVSALITTIAGLQTKKSDS